MKNFDFQSHDFRDMTREESHAYTGGGFAFDVGRFIRFMVLSAPGGIWVANGIYDAALNAL